MKGAGFNQVLIFWSLTHSCKVILRSTILGAPSRGAPPTHAATRVSVCVGTCVCLVGWFRAVRERLPKQGQRSVYLYLGKQIPSGQKPGLRRELPKRQLGVSNGVNAEIPGHGGCHCQRTLSGLHLPVDVDLRHSCRSRAGVTPPDGSTACELGTD